MARYANPKAITGKAVKESDMVREMAHAMDVKLDDAREVLIHKGYAKVAAELSYIRRHAIKKASKKPARKAARKSVKKARPIVTEDMAKSGALRAV